jgi:hypothetical protein
MDKFLILYMMQFVDSDTSLNCKIAFRGLKIRCEKWIKLDALSREKKFTKMLQFACESGSLRLATYCLSRGKIACDKLNRGLYIACFGGYEKLVELLILNGARDYNLGLRGACEGGHKKLAELMITKGANSWDDGFYGACAGGHMALVELMISKGANCWDWDWALCDACTRGCKELAELMITKGADDWNRGLECACRAGHKKLSELMISHGANCCNCCRKSVQSHLN